MYNGANPLRKILVKLSTKGLLVLVLAAVWLPAACAPAPHVPPKDVPEDLTKVWKAYQELEKRYVHKGALDPDKLADAAVSAPA